MTICSVILTGLETERAGGQGRARTPLKVAKQVGLLFRAAYVVGLHRSDLKRGLLYYFHGMRWLRCFPSIESATICRPYGSKLSRSSTL